MSGSAPIVAIIGATGKTGKWALRGALQRNYTVRVLARSAKKLEPTLTAVFGENRSAKKLEETSKTDVEGMLAKVTVVEGSATDHDKLVELCSGATVVVSFLGMTKPPEWIVQPGVEAVMKALQTLDNPPKFITLSSIGMSGSRPQADKAWGCCGCMAKLMIEHMLADVFKDMQAAEDQILKATDSKLVVTIARATVLGDKANYFKDYSVRKPGYKLQAEDDLGGTTLTIDRQHVAEAILDLAETSEWDNKQPSIFSA